MKEKESDPRLGTLEAEAQKFLSKHPEAAKALELFGISFDYYEEFIAAQSKPLFYTSGSTNQGA